MSETHTPIKIGAGTPVQVNVRTIVAVLTITGAATAGWLSKPSKAEVEAIAQVAAERSAAALRSDIQVVSAKTDALLLMTADQRGDAALRKVRANISDGRPPAEGIVPAP